MASREAPTPSTTRRRLLRDKCDKVEKQNCYQEEGTARGPSVAPAHRCPPTGSIATGAGVGAAVGAAPRAASTLAARCRDHVTTAAAPAKREAFGPKMTVAAQHARIFARRDRGASFDLWVYRRQRTAHTSVTDTRFERVTFRTGI